MTPPGLSGIAGMPLGCAGHIPLTCPFEPSWHCHSVEQHAAVCRVFSHTFLVWSCQLMVSSEPSRQQDAPRVLCFNLPLLERNPSKLFLANRVGWRVLCFLKIAQKGDAAFSLGHFLPDLPPGSLPLRTKSSYESHGILSSTWLVPILIFLCDLGEWFSLLPSI